MKAGLGFMAASGGAASDPYFSMVQLLLHGNGANGGTSFPDSSSFGRNIVVAKAGVTTESDQFKFGGSSMKFSGGSLGVNGAGIILSGDFTVELWVRSSIANGSLLAFGSFSSDPRPIIYLQNNNLFFATGATTRITGGSVSQNEWHHVALSRNSNVFRMYIDGTQTGTTYTDGGDYTANSNRPYIGANANNSFLYSGWMQDLRITVGAGRYPSDFAIPSGPFPDG